MSFAVLPGGGTMAEVMTVESILEADWLLQGFWTRPRFPLHTENGGWSDIDVLAYAPEARHLVISESKVRGPKKDVYAYTAHTQAEYGDILSYDGGNYFGFLRHIGLVCENGAIFSDFRRMVKRLTVQLVSNYFVAADVRPSTIETVEARIRKDIPDGVALDVRLETTLDVICRIIALEKESGQGRRYGHPVIDMARELNRYMHPQVRYAGRDRHATDEVRKALIERLWEAVRGERKE
jgi:hypothetical protein